MKNAIPLFLFLAVCSFANKAYTQDKISIAVLESSEKMSLGYNSCFKVFIPSARQKDIEHDWAKYMKSYNVKGNATKGEYFFDNAAIKSMGDNTVDVYSTANETKEGTWLMVFFDLGGVFLSSSFDPAKAETAKNILHGFGVDEAKAAVANQVQTALKIMDSKRKEQSNLERENNDLRKKIEDCKATIVQAEKDLETNATNQGAKKKEIEDQQKAVDALKAKQAGVE